MRGSALIPWKEVNSWSCVACGNCCVGYRIPLKIEEMVLINNRYGPQVMELGMGKAYLRNRPNGRCFFQRPLMSRWICTLQAKKPIACRLFPFRIQKEPIYKHADNAALNFKGNRFYLYLDPACEGINTGKPSDRFKHQVISEIIKIGMGIPVKQKFTTSKSIHWRPI
jgi:Fe-S-cluster containining protein